MEPSLSSGESESASEAWSEAEPIAASQDRAAGDIAGDREAAETGAPSSRSSSGQGRRDLVLALPELAATRSTSAYGAGPSFDAPPRTRGFSFWRRIDGFQAVSAAVLLGVGWLIGANMFNRHSDLARIEAQVHALGIRVAGAQAQPRAESSPHAAEIRSLSEHESSLRAEIAAIKAKVEAANRQTQARDAEMLASIGRLEKDPRFDQISGRLDRLERQRSSATPTGTLALAKPSAAAAPTTLKPLKPLKSAATHVSRSDPSQANADDSYPERMRIPVAGYVLRDVDHGVALIEDREGLHEVVPGDFIPGAGRVERIERRDDGGWVVVTSQGVIDESDY